MTLGLRRLEERIDEAMSTGSEPSEPARVAERVAERVVIPEREDIFLAVIRYCAKLFLLKLSRSCEENGDASYQGLPEAVYERRN